MNTILKLEHIQKYCGNEGNITKAIKDISFSVEAGEFLGIMGASGSGKTTLLNCISTIDTVSAGHIFLEGTDVTEINPKSLAHLCRENLGFVFQDFNLLDTLTISENIALALAINKVSAGSVEPRIWDIAQKLNISDILSKYPYQVSGGQKQRCACARAIINNPKLLLADEPTGALLAQTFLYTSFMFLLSSILSNNSDILCVLRSFPLPVIGSYVVRLRLLYVSPTSAVRYSQVHTFVCTVTLFSPSVLLKKNLLWLLLTSHSSLLLRQMKPSVRPHGISPCSFLVYPPNLRLWVTATFWASLS